MKPTLIKSHNDYKCKNPITDALSQGADILEVDVFFSGEDVYIGHSWCPSFLCKQDLWTYMAKLLSKWKLQNETTGQFFLFLQIEIKDIDPMLIRHLIFILKSFKESYDIGGIIVSISAINRWYHFGLRKRIKNKILKACPFVIDYDKIEKRYNVVSKDFYK